MSYEEFTAAIERITSEIDTEMARMSHLREDIMKEAQANGEDQPASRKALDLTKSFMDSADKISLLVDKRNAVVIKCGREIQSKIESLGDSVTEGLDEISDHVADLLKELGVTTMILNDIKRILLVECKNRDHSNALLTHMHEKLVGNPAYRDSRLILNDDETQLQGNPGKSREDLDLPAGPCVCLYQFGDLTSYEWSLLPSDMKMLLGTMTVY